MKKRIILGMLMMVVSNVFSADREFKEGEEEIMKKKDSIIDICLKNISEYGDIVKNNKLTTAVGIGTGSGLGYGVSEVIQTCNNKRDDKIKFIAENKGSFALFLTGMGGFLGGAVTAMIFGKRSGRREASLKNIKEYKNELELIEKEDLTPDARNAAKSRVMKFLNKEEENYKLL